MRPSFAFHLDDPTFFPVVLTTGISHDLYHVAMAIQTYVVGIVFLVTF